MLRKKIITSQRKREQIKQYYQNYSRDNYNKDGTMIKEIILVYGMKV